MSNHTVRGARWPSFPQVLDAEAGGARRSVSREVAQGPSNCILGDVISQRQRREVSSRRGLGRVKGSKGRNCVSRFRAKPALQQGIARLPVKAFSGKIQCQLSFLFLAQRFGLSAGWAGGIIPEAAPFTFRPPPQTVDCVGSCCPSVATTGAGRRHQNAVGQYQQLSPCPQVVVVHRGRDRTAEGLAPKEASSRRDVSERAPSGVVELVWHGQPLGGSSRACSPASQSGPSSRLASGVHPVSCGNAEAAH